VPAIPAVDDALRNNRHNADERRISGAKTTGSRSKNEGVQAVSLHTIVSDGVVGRLHLRRAPAAVVRPRTAEMAVRLTGTSMRILETGMAVTAIATALLIGLGR
jgi:hypothetical protein